VIRYQGLIRSFNSKDTEAIFQRRAPSKLKLSPDILRRAYIKLLMIDKAENASDLRNPPGNRLEGLCGNLQEFSSIRINNQWRIIFRFEKGDAFDVEIIDYH
jgi:proteic killer suppression protein